MPDIPRRTLERDLEALARSGALKAVGRKKARAYELGPGERTKGTKKSPHAERK